MMSLLDIETTAARRSAPSRPPREHFDFIVTIIFIVSIAIVDRRRSGENWLLTIGLIAMAAMNGNGDDATMAMMTTL
jgi:hypothetical protein